MVFGFEQTVSAQRDRLRGWDVSGTRGCAMSKANEFWQYAEEAILSAHHAQSDEERRALFDLARTWTQAALIERHARSGTDTLPIAA